MAMLLFAFLAFVQQTACSSHSSGLRGAHSKLALIQRPNLADEEVRRLEMEKMGRSKNANKGGDDERLDWDDDDESIRQSREEEEYSLAQTAEGRPNLADEEVRRLEMEKMGRSKNTNKGGDDERLDWDDNDESIRQSREEEEYSLAQTGKKPCCHTFKPKHLPHGPRHKKEKKPTGTDSLLQTEKHSKPKFRAFKPRILHPRKEKKPTGAYSLAQTGASAVRSKRPTSLADQEADRLRLEHELGRGYMAEDQGGDEERLDWDDGDELIDANREEEEYSFAQTAKQ